MNVPNKLSLARILLVPFVVVFILTKEWPTPLIALILFWLASITDFLDGYLARKHGQVTRLGKLLDPIADKLLTISAFIAMVEIDKIKAWMVVIIVGREVAVTGLRAIAADEGRIIPASKWGKGKMVAQVVCISLILLDSVSILFFWLSKIALWVVVFLTVASGADYFIKFLKNSSFEL